VVKMPGVKIGVSGLTQAEVEEGLPHLLDEFGHRSRILIPQAYWDELTKRLVISVGYEINESFIEDVAMDEIWDCVIATINFQEEIHFEILKE